MIDFYISPPKPIGLEKLLLVDDSTLINTTYFFIELVNDGVLSEISSQT